MAPLALRRALRDAGCEPASVDYVNAHGTGTSFSDAAEARALTRALVGENDRLAISSTKGATGHAMGAASALEAVVTVLALHHDRTPPSAGLSQPDPDFDPALAGALGRHGARSVRVALSNGFGLGGNNAVATFGSPGAGDPVWQNAPVFVTGVAAIAAGQEGVDELCARLAGDRRLGAGEHRFETNARAVLGPKKLRHADRATVLAGVALQTQLAPWPRGVAGEEAGVVVGLAHPSFGSSLTVMRRLQLGGEPKLNPGAVPHSTGNSTASYLAIRAGVTGLNATVASGDCAGLDAVAFAANQIRRGRLRRALGAGVSGACDELWEGLGLAGRVDLAEAAGLIELGDDPADAWAEVLGSARAFGEDAVGRCCGVALSRSGLEGVDLVVTGSLAGAVGGGLGCAEALFLAPVVGEVLAAKGALAVGVAAHRIRDGKINSALVVECSPEGYASAMVLTCPIPR